MITRPHGRTRRHLKIRSNIHQVRFFQKSFNKKLAIIATQLKSGQRIKFNVKKAVVKLLLDKVVIQTMLGGLTVYVLWLKISYSVYVPKIMKIDWQWTKLLQK